MPPIDDSLETIWTFLVVRQCWRPRKMIAYCCHWVLTMTLSCLVLVFSNLLMSSPWVVLRGRSMALPPVRGLPPPPLASQNGIFSVSVAEVWDENLVIMHWFYVKNCIFEHIADRFFQWTCPPLWIPRPSHCLLPPNVEMIEPPLIMPHAWLWVWLIALDFLISSKMQFLRGNNNNEIQTLITMGPI